MTCATSRSKGAMPVRRFTATEQFRATDIPRGEIGPRPHPLVLMFDFRDMIRPRRHRRMAAATRLNARFLVGREDVVLRRQRFALPDAGVQIEDGTGFRRKVRDPAGTANCDGATAGSRRRRASARPSCR